MASHKKFLMTTEARVGEYWLATYSVGGGTRNGIATDQQGNLYDVNIGSKIGLDASPIWSKGVPNGTPPVNSGGGVASDNQDFYATYGIGTVTIPTETSGLLIKLGIDGSIVWQRALGKTDPVTAGYNERLTSVSVDTSSNVVVAGETIDGSSSADGIVAKYNSSGTLQWQRQIAGSSPTSVHHVATDTSDDIMVALQTSPSLGASGQSFYVRYQSDGTADGQLIFGNISTYTTGTSHERVAADSLGNFILVGSTKDATLSSNPTKTYVVKVNSSNSVVWKREFFENASDTRCRPQSVACDRFGNTYVAVQYEDDTTVPQPTYRCVILKYNSSGTLQWQKLLSESGNSYGTQPFGISASNNGDVFMSGRFVDPVTSFSQVVLKAPPDGSGDGTYGTFTYADATGFTEQASSIPIAASSLTLSTPTLTSSTPSFVVSDTTVTETVYPITP